ARLCAGLPAVLHGLRLHVATDRLHPPDRRDHDADDRPDIPQQPRTRQRVPGALPICEDDVNVAGLRFAANLSILYGHLPLLRRPAAAAADGFTAVETWWPFTEPTPPDRQTDAFAAALADAGVGLVAMNLVEGDMRAGDRGLVSNAHRVGEFR